jgi:hypothetical protein
MAQPKNKRNNQGNTSSFARGSELWMHQARLFLVALRTVFIIALSVGLAIATAYFWQASTPDERYGLERNLLAKTRLALFMTAGKMELNITGALRKLEVS